MYYYHDSNSRDIPLYRHAGPRKRWIYPHLIFRSDVIVSFRIKEREVVFLPCSNMSVTYRASEYCFSTRIFRLCAKSMFDV